MSTEIEFFVVSHETSFTETKEKGALLEATVLELNKKSEGNNRVYQIEEGPQIAASLKDCPVYYGVNPFNKHDNPIMDEKSTKEPSGFVEKAWVVGNKIKALVRITAQSLIETLKLGTKYLFSVGGVAISETIKKIGDALVHFLHGARCNHLQILDVGTSVGFPSAKTEKLIEINETVMFFNRKPNISGNRFIEIVGNSIARIQIEKGFP